jgi:hypothetical protein
VALWKDSNIMAQRIATPADAATHDDLITLACRLLGLKDGNRARGHVGKQPRCGDRAGSGARIVVRRRGAAATDEHGGHEQNRRDQKNTHDRFLWLV